jgi:hypothetical protein
MVVLLLQASENTTVTVIPMCAWIRLGLQSNAELMPIACRKVKHACVNTDHHTEKWIQ